MRSKKKKFQELKTFNNVFEWDTKGVKKDLKKLFKQRKEIILELGCGKGEYTVQLAKRYPEKIFIGVDIQGERIWKGAKQAIEENLPNVYFLRVQIENIQEYIPKKSITEIWLTFPDPFPKDRQVKKRLTSPRFLDIYKKILKKGGVINLKTDSQGLYEYTLRQVVEGGLKIEKDCRDIYSEGNIENVTDIQTTFEKKHLEKGKKIKYLRFVLR
ncbi:MAG: tRNA (guanine-N(7)-)-methyltransferase [candidate division WS6 bacterium 36_33]|uniref:tRNA (guanine-N(7)-)-methyltransferase n=1 Tax=candidate division WS6 bacterium 36_33 TaxID=1641388 RepID=A0A124FU59_9BACT|nr:MAG: tRNA (guanine-N(7)-)-methyltransferase [candidate division WS6 bacterium 36_33]